MFIPSSYINENCCHKICKHKKHMPNYIIQDFYADILAQKF